jgi:hypothetical protein
MGSSVKTPTPPPAPTPVDPGKSSLDFIRAMADPALQRQLLQAEQTYRPEYTELELADINTLLRGTEDQAGMLALQDEAAQSVSDTTQRLTAAQRLADIKDVETLGGRATAALRASDPMQQAIVNQLNALAADRYSASGQLSPQEMRGAQQSARLSGLSRGRVGDVGTVASEVLNREQALPLDAKRRCKPPKWRFPLTKPLPPTRFKQFLVDHHKPQAWAWRPHSLRLGWLVNSLDPISLILTQALTLVFKIRLICQIIKAAFTELRLGLLALRLRGADR